MKTILCLILLIGLPVMAYDYDTPGLSILEESQRNFEENQRTQQIINAQQRQIDQQRLDRSLERLTDSLNQEY